MSCNCKLSYVSNPNGHTLTATITGDFSWFNTTNYPSLPVGDANAPVSDQNPIATFQDILGQVSAAMKLEGISDANNDPNVLEFNNVDRMDACKFQWMLLRAAERLTEIGIRLATNRQPNKKFDATRAHQSWRLSQTSGRKGKAHGQSQGGPKSTP